MAQVETIIRYDGPALAGHDMDVEELAPALLALASLIQTANHKFNGDRSAVRVVVNADIEQKCFQIQIKLIQDILQHAKSFLDGDMATLKEICEWIGIVSGSAATGWSLFKLIISIGKKQQDSTVFNTQAGNDVTLVQIQNLTLNLPEGTPKQVADLLTDPVIVSKAKEVLKPASLPGYETVSFVDAVSHTTAFQATKSEVESALAFELPELPVEDEEDAGDPTFAEGPAWVDTSHFRGNAKWVLMWGGARIDAKMPDEFVRQFQENEILVVPNTKLHVRMKITPKLDDHGNSIGLTSFVVEEVLSRELPPKPAVQQGLFTDKA